MRLERTIVVDRLPAAVFELVSDPSRVPAFFAGVTRWEAVSRNPEVSARDSGFG